MISKVQNQKSAIIYCITIISKNIFVNERNTSDCTLLIVNFTLFWAFRLRRRAFRYIFFRCAPKGCRSNP